MLKVRIIPLLIIEDGLLKKPVRFIHPRTVASPISIIRVFEERQVDELILVDRGNTIEGEDVDPGLVRSIAEELFVPFAFGGGIRTREAMKEIIQAGAEKIVINTAAVEIPGLITEGARKFGSQCIVVSIDVRCGASGSYEVYIRNGSEPTGLDAIDWAKQVEVLGAGEILINSISHDGVMQGFDIELIQQLVNAVKIPVIAAGGAGQLEDFVTVANSCSVSAIAAGSIYHYTKSTPNMVKGVLHKAGIPVRMYPDENYEIT